jgi:hypothetical protein
MARKPIPADGERNMQLWALQDDKGFLYPRYSPLLYRSRAQAKEVVQSVGHHRPVRVTLSWPRTRMAGDLDE